MSRRKRMLDDLDQDIREHIEIETQDNIARGMGPAEARGAALRKFGNVTQVKEDVREVWVAVWFEQLLQDMRFGVRMLRRNPGFTAAAVLTLALAIGANTAIFSVVYAVLLRPLPYPQADQLFNVFQVQQQQGISGTGWSYANFAAVREQNHVFSAMAGTQHHQLTLTGHGEPKLVNTAVVTPDFFTVFAAQALAGRVFSPDDGKRGATPVVVLSEALWRNTFGADPNLIGSSVQLDKRAFTVVGIMPATFRFPVLSETEKVWIPLVQDPLFGGWMERRGGHWLQVTGRLRPGVSRAQAQQDLAAISGRLAHDYPENSGWSASLVPLQDMIVRDVKPVLLVLLGAVGLVLLIGCANIANLLLTRATSRAREIAVRTALGAGRSRVIRQLLSETAVLGLLGGAAGIVVAYWGVKTLSSLLPASLPRVNQIAVDPTVLGFALLLTAIATLAFGIAPAIFAAHSTLDTNLREGTMRGSEGGARKRARSVLAAGEIALAMVLLAGAGLLLRSFSRLMSVSPGFEVRHMVKAEINLPRFQYPDPAQWASFADNLLTRVQAVPGMQESAIAIPLPVVHPPVNLGFEIVGTPALPGAAMTADYVAATPDYFRVLGIPLVAGRSFDRHDIASSPRVALISQTFARRYFHDENPIGKRLKFGFPPDPGDAREIVGVVADVRDVALGQDPGPMMYVPYAQAPFPGAVLLVRSTLGPAAIAAAIRRQVSRIDPDLPVTDVAPLPDVIAASLSQPRFRTFLVSLFAAMALLLAVIGIFGVIAYSVSSRTKEIGIRMALGASRAAIVRLVLRQTLALTAAGLAIGVPGAIAASRLLEHMLFAISAGDPATLAAMALLLAAASALAGYLPARRAARVDPLIALRYQ